MKSNLRFYDFETKLPSDCGKVLDIEFSNQNLDWPGIVLEKGSSPHFYPQNVFTPYFYFALGLEHDLHWSAETQDGMTPLKTSPGDIWINPPTSPFSHSISEPCYFIILAIEEEVFLNNASLNTDQKELKFLNNYNVHDETIKGIIELFMLEAMAGGKNGYSFVKNLINLLSTHYIQNYSNHTDLVSQSVNESKFDSKQVDRVDAFIDSNLGDSISVDDLSDLLGCSKYYFLREFKKFTGITPYQYLLSKRLERAKSLLSSPKCDIASVAIKLGFNDQAHFTRSFKNQFDVTPGQFQKRHKSGI